MPEELVSNAIELPSGELRLRQPRESAELPDSGGVEWAPLAPYWSVLWRSGVALARELDREALQGLRVVELGCGLGAPSIVAARGGAAVLATDAEAEALELLARNAVANDVRVETATVDWGAPGELLRRAPFDFVLAADVFYEPASLPQLRSLLPRLAPRAWVADPGRQAAAAFLAQVELSAPAETSVDGVVRVHRLAFDPALSSGAPSPTRPASLTVR